jgi:hypothetical protein
MSHQKTDDSSKEAHAYTPGLKIKERTIINKRRMLPLPGEILVGTGESVDFETIVARTMVPGEPYIIEATNLMGLAPEELPNYMVKKAGDRVKKDEPVAQWIALFGLIKRIARSPAEGTVESFSKLTGRVTVREDPKPIDVAAYIPGTIVEIIPNEGVTIETGAAYIQGIFGIGGEKNGILEIIVDSPEEILEEDLIGREHEGKIVVGGSFITLGSLKKAVEHKVSGIIVGGINAPDLNSLLGFRMGVAITGSEDIATTLVITEGFGKMAMSQRTFDILKSFEGERVSINGATQIRAGVVRPEVIIPLIEKGTEKIVEDLPSGITPGTPIRVIRTPYFGRLGKVTGLPVELQKLQTESLARVVEIELENGERVIVPRANVEIIEE